ncbi:calcium-binding protein [Chachezhania sediminis]|uniref:calcium-binding protein n=1 Tax=Chachezhania sediminis TaxID=2599291 RepID=UPI00131CDE27|nr:calcium-binding protein [Chachezhania sediminis]
MTTYNFASLATPAGYIEDVYPTFEQINVTVPDDVGQFGFSYAADQVGTTFPVIGWEYIEDLGSYPMTLSSDDWNSQPVQWQLAQFGPGSEQEGTVVAFTQAVNGTDAWSFIQVAGVKVLTGQSAVNFANDWQQYYDPANSEDMFTPVDMDTLGDVYAFSDLTYVSHSGTSTYNPNASGWNYFGGLGPEIGTGAEDDDFLAGGGGDDTLSGKGGSDIVRGGSGNDLVSGGSGSDTVAGGSGDDLVKGQKGHDKVLGKTGNDTVLGGKGHDIARGGQGDDIVQGGKGKDTVVGGKGHDVLSGGHGADDFVFRGVFGIDRITDFQSGSDTLSFKHIAALDGLTVDQFMADYVSVDGLNTVIDIEGAGQVTLQGYTGLSALADDIVLV